MENTNSQLIPIDSNQFYFPLDKFKDNSGFVGRDTFLVKWYSEQLFALREPVIYMDQSQKEIYRFTWLRTFDNPIAIRIEKQEDSYNLYWKLCNGAGGYEPGQLTIQKQKSINKLTWDEFKNRLKQTSFWNLKTIKIIGGLDGSEWILEGKTLDQYHVVDRWTPRENTKYYQCCDFLIGLTDLNITGNDKY